MKSVAVDQSRRSPSRRGAGAAAVAVAERRQSLMIRHPPEFVEMAKELGLTPKQVEAFKEAFDLFDVNGGGVITADKLDAAMKSVDIALSAKEIETILNKIDADGNGVIDFGEFLLLMTSTEKYLDSLRDQKEGEEMILFTALNRFMTTSALSSIREIQRYYDIKVRKAPHVVGHYAAGARLIGLSDKQLAKHLADLKASNADSDEDSPYAQPLQMFQVNWEPTSRQQRRVIMKKIKQRSNRREIGMKTDAWASVRDTSRVPLPTITLPSRRHDFFTVEKLPDIRSRVFSATRDYYKRVAREKASLTKQHWNDLSSQLRLPTRLQKNFKRIFETYMCSESNITTPSWTPQPFQCQYSSSLGKH